MSERIALRESSEDTIQTVLFELLGSAVHGLAVTPTTLSTLLDFLVAQAVPTRTSVTTAMQTETARVLSDSAPGCVSILLRTHPVISAGIEADAGMTIAQQAGTILIQAEMVSPGVISQNLSVITSEAAQAQIGVFIYILLASLDLPLNEARQRIVSLYPLLARSMSLCLRAGADFLSIHDAAGDGAELLSVVFAAFRLAILAAQDKIDEGVTADLGGDAIDALWARVWPDWYRLLSLSFDSKSINGVLKNLSDLSVADVSSSLYEL